MKGILPFVTVVGKINTKNVPIPIQAFMWLNNQVHPYSDAIARTASKITLLLIFFSL